MTDARRICRGVKSVFVPGALETADIATIRLSFRGEKRQAVWREGGGGRGRWKAAGLDAFWPSELGAAAAAAQVAAAECVTFKCISLPGSCFLCLFVFSSGGCEHGSRGSSAACPQTVRSLFPDLSSTLLFFLSFFLF